MADKGAPPKAASGADRISALPDDVLGKVLSLLPAHDAVRTTVLAPRWRDLWMTAPALRVTGWGSVAKFTDFVERLLLLRCGGAGTPASDPAVAGGRHQAGAPASLDSCHFDFQSSDFGSEENAVVDETLVTNWIKRVVTRCQVQVLGISIWYPMGEPFALSDLPLSRHLTQLELDSVSDNSGNSDRILDFSGSPALLCLKMRFCQIFAIEMWSPSLEHLSMTGCEFDLTERTLFHLPALISLKLVHCAGKLPMVESMPSLATATVKLGSGCSDTCSIHSVSYCSVHGSDNCREESCQGCSYYYRSDEDRSHGVILDALSEVTDLEVSALPAVYVFSRDLKFCATFGKLKTLVLTDWFVGDLSTLVWFLQYSPILEKLALNFSKFLKRLGTVGNYSLPEPSVASEHLKMVEIKCEEVDRMVLIILRILNSSGIPLEKINIQCSNIGFGSVNFLCTSFGSI